MPPCSLSRSAVCAHVCAPSINTQIAETVVQRMAAHDSVLGVRGGVFTRSVPVSDAVWQPGLREYLLVGSGIQPLTKLGNLLTHELKQQRTRERAHRPGKARIHHQLFPTISSLNFQTSSRETNAPQEVVHLLPVQQGGPEPPAAPMLAV